MESNESTEGRDELVAELRAAERAAAAPYIAYPSSPWWYAPAVGLWFAAILVAFARWSKDSGLVNGLLLLTLIVIELAFIRWLQKQHGAMPWPGMGNPPPEIGRVWRWYFVGVVAVAAAVAVVLWQGGVIMAAAASFVFVSVYLSWYEKEYRVAAAAVEARLA